MKILLVLLLLIPSLSWGSEKKARELYVKAKSDLLNNGCEFEILAGKFASMIYDTNDLVTSEISPLMDELKKCGNYYIENTLPVFDKIINEYPETEVAYNLMSGEEYISEGLLMGLMNFLEVGTEKINKKSNKEVTKHNEEPMTVSDMNLLQAHLYSCLEVNQAILENVKNLKPKIFIEVNKDRTVKLATVVDEDRYFTDQRFKLASDTVLRAINNPECSPLDLPVNKYNQWKKINFTVDFTMMKY